MRCAHVSIQAALRLMACVVVLSTAACGVANNGGGYYWIDGAGVADVVGDAAAPTPTDAAGDVGVPPHDVAAASDMDAAIGIDTASDPDVASVADGGWDAQPDVYTPPDIAAEDFSSGPDLITEPDVPTWPDVADVYTPADIYTPPDVYNPPDSTPLPDVAPPLDIGVDAGPNTCGSGHDIFSLLKCTYGNVDFQLNQALVTYVFAAGFLVYDASSTRGMMIYVGSTPAYPNPKVGDIVSLHVSKYGNYNGQQEVTASDNLLFVGSGDANGTALDLSLLTKAVLTDSFESRLLKGTGFVVKSLAGADGIVTTPGAGDVTLRIDGVNPLCAGATFDLKSAGLTQFGSVMRIHAMNGAADVANVDTTTCAAGPGWDASNWGFEVPDATDPPPGFYKLGAALSAVRTTSQAHVGAASAQLTWTSVDNQDFIAGYLQPIAPGQTATLGAWLLDNDPSGKARLCMTFLKSDQKTLVSNQFQATYTTDGAAWAQKSFAYVAPAEAAYVRGFVRLYDDGTAWTGAATVYVDDWTMSVQ